MVRLSGVAKCNWWIAETCATFANGSHLFHSSSLCCQRQTPCPNRINKSDLRSIVARSAGSTHSKKGKEFAKHIISHRSNKDFAVDAAYHHCHHPLTSSRPVPYRDGSQPLCPGPLCPSRRRCIELLPGGRARGGMGFSSCSAGVTVSCDTGTPAVPRIVAVDRTRDCFPAAGLDSHLAARMARDHGSRLQRCKLYQLWWAQLQFLNHVHRFSPGCDLLRDRLLRHALRSDECIAPCECQVWRRSKKLDNKAEEQYTKGIQNVCSLKEHSRMGQATRTTKLSLDLGERDQGGANEGKTAALPATVEVLETARASYLDFFLAHADKLAERVVYYSEKHLEMRERAISANELLTWAESCTVSTKDHPHPWIGWNFSERFPDLPFAYRRSVIKDAIGKARSYLSHRANWENSS